MAHLLLATSILSRYLQFGHTLPSHTPCTELSMPPPPPSHARASQRWTFIAFQCCFPPPPLSTRLSQRWTFMMFWQMVWTCATLSHTPHTSICTTTTSLTCKSEPEVNVYGVLMSFLPPPPRDCQGFCNLCGLRVGYMGVRVWVGFSNPRRTCTPGTGWWVTYWLPTKLNLGFQKLDRSLNQDRRWPTSLILLSTTLIISLWAQKMRKDTVKGK